MAQREADGEEARKRRVLHAKVEANLRAARRKWQKDQASGGLEGWGMEDRSEREHRWYAIRPHSTMQRESGTVRAARGGVPEAEPTACTLGRAVEWHTLRERQVA